jgi:hypothetical protein
MRRTTIFLLLFFGCFVGTTRGQTGVISLSVTSTPLPITVNVPCNYVVIQENSATPTNAFTITLPGGSTGITYAAGVKFIFSSNTGGFLSGQTIGTITVGTGTVSFVGIESISTPTVPAKTGGGGGGGGGGGSGSVNQGTYPVIPFYNTAGVNAIVGPSNLSVGGAGLNNIIIPGTATVGNGSAAGQIQGTLQPSGCSAPGSGLINFFLGDSVTGLPLVGSGTNPCEPIAVNGYSPSFPQITSTVSTGTPPFVVASTTNVPNLNASSLNGATFASPGPIGSTSPSTGAFTTITTSGQVLSLADSAALVQFVGTDGSDSNTGLSWGAAKLTLQAALNVACASGSTGGVVYLGPGVFATSGSEITIPNDSGTIPSQASCHIIGTGRFARSTVPTNTPGLGTALNLTYNASVGKIDTLGVGQLEIDHLTLEDTGSDCAPFVFTTNTTVHIHDVSFVGTAATTSACNDAIILGGTGTTTNGTSSAPFQGYGSVIENNWFNFTRRAVFGQVYANGVQITNNTIWNQAGSNLSAGAAIEFNGTGGSPSVNAGGYIAGNLIEGVGYYYGIKLVQSENFSIIGNNTYDLGVNWVAQLYTDSSDGTNTVLCGFYATGKCDTNNATGGDLILDGTNNNPTTFSSVTPVLFPVGLTAGTPTYQAPIQWLDSSNNATQIFGAVTSGKPTWTLAYTPNGMSDQPLMSMNEVSSGIFDLSLPNGSTEQILDAPSTTFLIRNQTSGGNITLTPGSGGHIGAPNLYYNATIVADLPSASTAGAGATFVVTDAASYTVGTCTGSGPDTMIAVSNGSVWTCH